MPQASRRVFVVGAFLLAANQSKLEESNPVARRSLSQLHSYRGRRDVVLRLGAESWCLSIGLCLAAKPKQSGFVVDERSEPTLAFATDAVSNPTTRAQHSGGFDGTQEGSNPSPTTAHLNNDRVVQRRRAGRRSHNGPA